MMNFIPLNVFSNYALLKSALTLDEYFMLLSKRNIKSAGISDPQYLYAFPYFQKLATKKGIKPLFGVRYLIENTDVILYIVNKEGYRDLMAIFEVDFKGQLTLNSLKPFSDHLIVILPTSNLNTLELNEDVYRDYFKKWAMATSSFYIGLERESLEKTTFLRAFAIKYNYDIVAFPHIKYATPEDYQTYLMIAAIREGTTLEMNQITTGPDYFLSDDDLARLYEEHELLNTVKISEKLAFSFGEKHPLNLPLPTTNSALAEITQRTHEKLRSLGLNTNETYLKRLNHEISVIEKLGFLNYFLIVSDYVRFARGADILVGYGRGSAPGSLVSYLLNITFVDPLKYDLLFERFLNPARISMPDIDIDFMDTRRNEVIDYIKRRYGDDHVAQIITFQTNAAKASLRDAGRIYNIDLKFINRLSQSLGTTTYSLREAYKLVPAFKTLIDADGYNLEIIRQAVKLEGFPRQSGLHAAGIIIDGEPLSKSLPTFMNNGMRVTQYEMAYLEEQGFLKVDILGLSNLTFIQNIINLVKEVHGVNLDYYQLNFHDPHIYEVIREGLTSGLFQLESDGMRKAIKEIKPSSFDDVSALLALYRPGPMQYINDYAQAKRGEINVTYLNDDFKRILGPTYGIMIFQEQIMQVVTAMAGFSLAEADLLRRAISKKDEKIIINQKKHFLEGAKAKGFSLNESEKVFNDILKFADYGFNKSHSVVYAMTTMALAYLKTYYPHEFYRELLKNMINDPKKFALVRSELTALNIAILGPDINHSSTEFVTHENGLLFPLSAIVGVNSESVHKIIALRLEEPFSSVQDFFFRTYNAGISENELQALIEAGALDRWESNRALLKTMLLTYIPTLEIGLFNDENALKSILIAPIEENRQIRINEEVSRLRFPLSSNPLDYIKIVDTHPLKEILVKENGTVKTFGIITSYRQIKTKRGDPMAFATMSDYENTLNLVIFPRALQTITTPLIIGDIYIIIATIEKKDDELQLIVSSAERYQHD